MRHISFSFKMTKVAIMLVSFLVVSVLCVDASMDYGWDYFKETLGNWIFIYNAIEWARVNKSHFNYDLNLTMTNGGVSSISHTLEYESYTAKNYHLFKVDKNRMQQRCAAHIVHSCQQYCSALLSLNQPAIRCKNAEQYCWQLWTIWAAQHCCILFSSTLNKW